MAVRSIFSIPLLNTTRFSQHSDTQPDTSQWFNNAMGCGPSKAVGAGVGMRHPGSQMVLQKFPMVVATCQAAHRYAMKLSILPL